MKALRGVRASTYPNAIVALTLLLSLIVWSDFLLGHVLNNLQGLARQRCCSYT